MTYDVRRTGIALAIYPFHDDEGIEIERAPDDGGGGPDTGNSVNLGQVFPGVTQYVDPRPLDGANWHYRCRHAYGTATASSWTAWAAAVAIELPLVLPPNPPEAVMDLDMFVDPATGEITLYINGSPRVKTIKWAANINQGSFPDAEAGTEVATDGDGDVTVVIPTGTLQAAPGDDVKAAVAFYDKQLRLLGILRDRESAGVFVDASPILDEDDGVLNLRPQRSPFALAVYYKVYTTTGTATKNDVLNTGTLSTLDLIPSIHTFTTDGEAVEVGVVATQNADGSGETGELDAPIYTYHTAPNMPVVTWLPFIPTTDGKEGIRITAVSDAATVRIFYRQYVDGAGPPGYTDTGLLSDPVVVDIEVTRPVEGANAVIVEFYAQDAEGVDSGSAPIQVRVDGNFRPAGTYMADLDEVRRPVMTISRNDPDTGSWRISYRVATSRTLFTAIAYSDILAWEHSGNTFNGEQVGISSTYYPTDAGEMLNCELIFFRTASTVAADQSASMKSDPVRFTVSRQPDTIPATFSFIASQDGTDLVGNIVLKDPSDYVDGIAFEVYPGDGAAFAPDPDPGSWSDVDTTPPFLAADLEKTTPLVEGRQPKILAAIRQDVGDGEGSVWGDSKEISGDKDLIPKFTGSLGGEGLSVRLQGEGDEDQGSIRWAKSKSAMPVTTVGGTTVNGRAIDVEVEAAQETGETLFVLVTSFSGAGATGIENTDDLPLQYSRDTKIPTFELRKEWDADEGTVTIKTIDDPSGVVNVGLIDMSASGAAYVPPLNRATWDVYDTVAPFTNAHTEDRDEKHVLTAHVGIGYDLGDGAGQKWDITTTSIPAKRTAEVGKPSLSRNTDGELVITCEGDADTAFIYFTFNVGASPGTPSDPAGSETEKVTGRTGTYETSTAWPEGHTVICKARGKNADGDMAPTAAVTITTKTRDLPAPGLVDVVHGANQVGGNVTHTVTWNENAGVNDVDHDIDVEYFEDDAYVAEDTNVTPSTGTTSEVRAATPSTAFAKVYVTDTSNNILATYETRRLAVTS